VQVQDLPVAVGGDPHVADQAALFAAASQAGSSPTVALGRAAASARIASWCGRSRDGTWLRRGRAQASPASRSRRGALNTYDALT
jgi:hypothetical protein